MREAPHAVLFDWEGTLVDFQWNLAAAVKQAHQELTALGFPGASLDSHYAMLRNRTVLEASARGIDGTRARQAVDRVYDHYDDDALSRWALKPAARNVLHFLGEHRVAAGLVTNIGRRAVEEALHRFDLEPAFRVIVTRDDVSMLKPDTEGIQAALRGLRVSPGAALFVGDSTADIRAARQARVPVAIVSGGENSNAIIAIEEPDFLWDSLDTVRTLFTGGE